LRRQSRFPGAPAILGVDVRCGTPVLQIRNVLREKGITDVASSAFTTQAKYFYDLQGATDGHTDCDRIDFISEHYREGSFDIVLLGEPVNTYAEPVRVAENLLRLVRGGGCLLLKLRNTADIVSLFCMLGIQTSQDGDMPAHLSPEDLTECLKAMGARNIRRLDALRDVPKETTDTLVQALRDSKICPRPEQAVKRLNVQEFTFLIEK